MIQELKSAPGEKSSIIEALKIKDINNLNNKNLISTNDSDKIVNLDNSINGKL